MGMDFAGVIVSTDLNRVQKVVKEFYRGDVWVYEPMPVKEDAEPRPPLPTLYALYYAYRRLDPEYRGGPAVIGVLNGAPWRWQAVSWDYGRSEYDIVEVRGELWGELDLKGHNNVPYLRMEMVDDGTGGSLENGEYVGGGMYDLSPVFEASIAPVPSSMLGVK